MPNDALADAKKTLADANKKFPSPAPAAAAPATPPKSSAQAKSLADELVEKNKNVERYKDANGGTMMPKMHKGGVVKHDGPHNLQKGEVVIPKDKVMKSAKGMLEGMAEGAEEKKSKAEPKEKKDEKKPKHAAKRPRHMHVERANGGFIVKHDYDMPEDKNEAPMGPMPPHVLPDMASLHAHMDEHMGEPEPGEAAAEMAPQQ